MSATTHDDHDLPWEDLETASETVLQAGEIVVRRNAQGTYFIGIWNLLYEQPMKRFYGTVVCYDTWQEAFNAAIEYLSETGDMNGAIKAQATLELWKERVVP